LGEARTRLLHYKNHAPIADTGGRDWLDWQEASIEESWMEVTVTWQGANADPAQSSMRFVATTGSGHRVEMDGAIAPEGEVPGGANLAARPMEVVLAGTGGCTAYDVVLILRRARQAVSACDVRLVAERAADDPKVFTRIHFHFVVRGHALREETVARAIELSHTKYCSASIMLEKMALLTHSHEIIEDAVDATPASAAARA
jgi:putative redox protein